MSNKREIVVGAFLLAGLLATGAVIFTIGNQRRVFDPKVSFVASFPDVQGLKAGAPVRLSGIDIGNVTSVEHGPNPDDDRLYVKMQIVQAEAQRIRQDSVASVANKGLLGDKMMEITPGTPGKASMRPGSTLQSKDPADYSNMLVQAGEIATKADSVLANLQKATSTFADDRVRQDMQDSLRSVTVILNNVASGQGYAARFLNDPAEAERISRVVTDLDRTSQRLSTTIEGVNQVLDRVKSGPGFAHSVIYEDEANKSVRQIGDAAVEVGLALRGVREGNGLAKSLLYGGPGQEKIGENLTAMSGDMRAIVAGVRAGKGTLGGLLVDPSIYEDMKSVLGNVQRNDVLRALVRYSIKQDEKKPAVEVTGGPK